MRRELSYSLMLLPVPRDLMAKEELQKLGFHNGSSATVTPSEADSRSREQKRRGFIAGMPPPTTAASSSAQHGDGSGGTGQT